MTGQTRAQRLAVGLLALACLCLVGLFVSGSSSAQGAGVYIVAGDSISAGIGSSLPRARGYAAHVSNWLGTATGQTVVLENYAVPGETVATFRSDGQLEQVLAAIEDANSAGLPVVALSLSLGGNELLALQPRGIDDRQEALSQFERDFAATLADLRAAAGAEVPIVVITYYDLTQGDPVAQGTDSWWVSQFNAAIARIAAEHGATVADVAGAFQGRIGDLTLYPYDVHPNNAGHREIARHVIAATGHAVGDVRIAVISSTDATRSTPTLRFSVDSTFEVAAIEVTSDTLEVIGPFETGDGTYAVLLDAGDATPETATVTIQATDAVGTQSATSVTVTFDTGQGG